MAGVLDDATFQAAYAALLPLMSPVVDRGDMAASDAPANDEVPPSKAPPARTRIQLPAVVMRDERTRVLVERADEAWATVTALMASGELASAPDPGLFAWTSPEDRAANPLWFVYDPLLPAVWVDGQMALMRSDAALILFDALREHAAPDAELQRSLVRMWAREYLVFAKYLANAAGVPIGLVSGNDGPSAVDFTADQARHEAQLDELYQAACEAAQRERRE